MNIEAVFDLISLLAYVTAVIIGVVIWYRGGVAGDRLSAGLILAATALLAFIALSNSLQYLQVTASLDVFEDYIEVLVFPLMAYGTYVMHSTQQVNDLRLTTHVARAEHDLMLSIIDASPVALVVVDEHGHVTFANDLARGVLRMEESEGAAAHTGSAHVVPQGQKPDDTMRGIFHETALRGGLAGEVFDVLVPGEDPLSIRVSSSSLGDDSLRRGAVIVFQAASVVPMS